MIRTILALLMLVTPLVLQARYDVTPPCYKDLEQNFLNPADVKIVLSLYNVEQGSWQSILNSIDMQKKGIHERLFAAGRKMQHNPLDNKYEPNAAAQLLQQELFHIFNKACRDNLVSSEANIKAMFADIEYRQSAKIQACFGRDTLLPKKEDES